MFLASNNDINGNRRISTSAGDLNSINQNQKMPFVPSKRTIQHHEYQNLVDDVTPSIVNGLRKRETSRQRHKSEHGTYDSIMPMSDNRYVDNNNNQQHQHQQQQPQQQMKRESNRTSVTNASAGSGGQQMVNGPVYRHFGDTNLMRNHNGKSPINHNRNLMNKSNSTTSLATTAICGGGGSSAGGDSSSSIYNSNRYRTRSIGQDIDQHSYSDGKIAADKLNNNRNGIRSTTAMPTTTDTFNPMASNPYITSNLTNDTGFSSMDADNSSTITPTNRKISDKTNKTNATNSNNNYYSAFDKIHRMNYDVKNRIKMFDVVDRSAAYRPVVCHKNYNPRSDKRFVQTILFT